MPAPPRRADVRLNPGVQRQLDVQRRQEEVARARARKLRLYVGLPLLIGSIVGSIAMWQSDDTTVSLLGNLIASSVLWVLWKVRKQIKSALGFG